MTTPSSDPDNSDAKDTTAVTADTDSSTADLTSDEPAEASDPTEDVEPAAEAPETVAAEPDQRQRFRVGAAVAFGVLPVVALLLAAAAGYLKWQDNSVRAADLASTESTQAAKDATVKLLSYKPDTVEQDLGSARDLLTGEFKDSYTQLTHDVVIPGAKEKQVSAVASVPAVASISAAPNHAEALVFVNQTVIVGKSAPTDTASSVKVTLERVGDHWLISGFDPV